jgi:hypothetical protein
VPKVNKFGGPTKHFRHLLDQNVLGIFVFILIITIAILVLILIATNL